MPERNIKGRKEKKRGGIDLVLFAVMCLMLTFGLIMVYSASAPTAFYREKNQFAYINKQLFMTLIGFVGLFVAASVDYHVVKKYSGWLLGLSALLMVLVIGIGTAANGAQRWLKIGPISFQPSEMAKFCLIFYGARFLSTISPKNLRTFSKGEVPYFAIVAIFCGLMLFQRHLSAAVVTFATMIILITAGGANMKRLVIYGLIGVVVAILCIKFVGFRSDRIEAYLHPFENDTGIGWQISHGLYAIGSGGIFGRGLGQAREKYMYVPEAHNDYIYAILCEEFGLIGAIAVAVLFAVFLFRCLKIAMYAPDKFAKFTVYGIMILISLQYIINVSVVTNTIPNTGMQLPFFSAGGSSLIFLMTSMGVVFNISRYTHLPDRKGEKK